MLSIKKYLEGVNLISIISFTPNMSFLSKLMKFFGLSSQANNEATTRYTSQSENRLSRSSSTLTRNSSNNPESSLRSSNTSETASRASLHNNQRKQVPNTSSSVSNTSSQISNNASQQSSSAPKTMKITINTVNGKKTQHTVPSSITGIQLKQYIYDNCCQSLQPKSMSLYYEGTVIGNMTKLSSINIVVGTQLVIRQDKISVGQISQIISDVHGIDIISQEQGTAQMPCKHHIGRDTMTVMIRSLISTNSYQIRCPYPDQNQLTCNSAWQFSMCKKVGVFTAEEVEEFEKGLSLNWIKEFCKKCPKCKQQICKAGLKINRVVCPSCRFGDFCFLCLKPWKGNTNHFCGNQQCKFLNEFLTTCPWNKKFQLRDPNDNNTVKTYMTPQYRACPHCNLIIEHSKACKHMTCKGCGKGFCWICLGVKTQSWSCGSYNQYCGKVAQAQKL